MIILLYTLVPYNLRAFCSGSRTATRVQRRRWKTSFGSSAPVASIPLNSLVPPAHHYQLYYLARNALVVALAGIAGYTVGEVEDEGWKSHIQLVGPIDGGFPTVKAPSFDAASVGVSPLMLQWVLV